VSVKRCSGSDCRAGASEKCTTRGVFAGIELVHALTCLLGMARNLRGPHSSVCAEPNARLQCTDLSLRASSTFSRCSANPGTTSLSTPLNLVVAAPTSALVIVSQPLRASCLAGLSPVAAAVAAAAPIGSD